MTFDNLHKEFSSTKDISSFVEKDKRQFAKNSNIGLLPVPRFKLENEDDISKFVQRNVVLALEDFDIYQSVFNFMTYCRGYIPDNVKFFDPSDKKQNSYQFSSRDNKNVMGNGKKKNLLIPMFIEHKFYEPWLHTNIHIILGKKNQCSNDKDNKDDKINQMYNIVYYP